MSDRDLLAVPGFGKQALAFVRENFPVDSEQDQEQRCADVVAACYGFDASVRYIVLLRSLPHESQLRQAMKQAAMDLRFSPAPEERRKQKEHAKTDELDDLLRDLRDIARSHDL